MTGTRELIDLLKKEIELYEELLRVEKLKTDAVTSGQAKLLDRYCAQQDELIACVSSLEDARVAAADRLRPEPARPEKGHRTLKELAACLPEHEGRELVSTGLALKKIITSISRLQKMNKALIEDNLEYCRITLKGMKSQGTLHAGYDGQGKENGKVAGSLLFNQTA